MCTETQPFADPEPSSQLEGEWESKEDQPSISCLPPEILSSIFLHLRDSFTGSIDVNPWAKPCLFEPWHWSVIAQVCRLWRQLALNTPTLWSQIILSSDWHDDWWLQEMCRRSKQSLLHIVVDSVNPLQFPGLMKHMGRCRALSLRQLHHNTLREFLQNIDASQLEYLLIYSSYRPQNDNPFILDDTVIRTKSLCQIRLYSCSVNWESSHLRRITQLWLANIQKESRLSCRDFVTFLSNIPVLEMLHLSAFIGDLAFVEESAAVLFLHPEGDRTHLRSLKRVHISCAVGEVANFLSRLDLPPSCQLKINTWDVAIKVTLPVRLILSWIAHHFQPPSSTDVVLGRNFFQSFCLQRVMHAIYIKGFSDVVTHDHIMSGREPILELVIQWDIWWTNSVRFKIDDAILQPFFTSLPLGRVVYLELSEISDLSLSDILWLHISSLIPNLERIFIGSDARPFFHALSLNPNNSALCPFSALSSIILEKNHNFDFKPILPILYTRSESGFRIRELLLPMECYSRIPFLILKQLQATFLHVGFYSR